MRPLSDMQLRELMPTSWNASRRGSRPTVLIAFLCHAAHYCYSLAVEEVTLHTLRMGRHSLDSLFLTQIHSALKFCPHVLETVGVRVPARYI
jgi:hypothetical protein